ncbi:PCNA-associated factor [Labrus mixtus]|uniref:PCNA-associated factor n=1 Tax=Labrus mixtus TaxID=508554 RepID=UPI0029BFCB72|nr:PCNA-associated factor [Labrus mixtus]
MVRTKADSVPGTYRKAVAASAPRKSLGSSAANAAASSSSSSSQCSTPAKGKYAGGNPVCARPTPTWQKGIGDFFGGPPRKPEKENQRPREVEDDEEAGGSGMSKASRKSRPLPVDEEDDE